MSNEELVREIVSKLCPFHGTRATVNMHVTGEIEISACCKEFQIFLGTLIKNKFQQGINARGAPEIILDDSKLNQNHS